MSRNAWPAAALPALLCSLAACEPTPPPPPPPAPLPEVTLSWVGALEGESCTSGVLNLGAYHQGDNPEQVTLLRNGQLVANLVPPYTYPVDCDRDMEGTHSFELRAKIGMRWFTSPIKTLRIDRTRPYVAETSPNLSSVIRKDSPITFRFSEPVTGDASTATTLRDETGPLAHTATLSAGGTVLTIVPKNPLRAPSELQATLSAYAFSDAAGLRPKEVSVTMSWQVLPFIRTEAALSSDQPVALARGPSGTPWMAHIDFPTGVTVRRWASDGWKPIEPNIPVDGFNGEEIALTLDATEAPIVAIVEDPSAGDPFIRVHRWSGGRWQQIGGNIAVYSKQTLFEWLSVGVDSRGNPSVAWYENYAVQVRRWTGTGWEALGAPIGTISDDTESPVLAVDSKDRVVLAYSQQPAGSYYNRVVVQRWESGAWVPLGTPLASASVFSISGVDLTIGPDDAPVVAWIESGNDYDVFAARWTAGKWEMSPLLGKAFLYEVSVATDVDGKVLVAWWNDDPYVGLDRRWVHTAQFDSGAWSTGVKACLGEDPRATFTPDGTALLWTKVGSSDYQPFIEH
ncbi:Ig-like domain-containing protein [Archangium gephyra]|uniref:Ig-like domain-containing protein n=1 Tax=Archangium gephyra TaxID=48 RepID=UPI0035D516A7